MVWNSNQFKQIADESSGDSISQLLVPRKEVFIYVILIVV